MEKVRGQLADILFSADIQSGDENINQNISDMLRFFYLMMPRTFSPADILRWVYRSFSPRTFSDISRT